jgi:hypothetical protein
MDENQIDPNSYGYEQTDVVSVPAELFQRVRTVLDFFLSKETQELYADNYKFVDKTTGKEVEKPNENTTKIVDIQKTLSPKDARVYRSREGIEILRLKLMTEEVHLEMIKSGIAKHLSHFEPKKAEAPLGDTSEGTKE